MDMALCRYKEILMLLAGLLLGLCASLASAEDDWQQAAARAAQTTKSFYETNGARDTRVIPEAYKVPVTNPRAHIEEADRKVAAQQAAMRAKERAAEREVIKGLKTARTETRTHYVADLKGIQTNLQDLQSRLATAQSDKKKAEADKAALKKDQNIVESGIKTLGSGVGVGEQALLDARIRDADSRIKILTGQVRHVQEALSTKQGEVVRVETRFELEIAKAQSTSRAAEEARRLEEATRLARDYITQGEQIKAAEEQFAATILNLDTRIATATRNGLDGVAAQLEKDKKKTIEVRAAVKKSQEGAQDASRRLLTDTYTENRRDGIGPTSTVGLRSDLRRAAREEGKDPKAAEDLVDHDAVNRTKTSAKVIADAAHKSTEHTSIFNEVTSESVHDFFLDLKEDKLTWYEFSLRVGSYTKGAGRATKDAVVDLLTLVKEIGDTAGETFESQLLERLGIDSHVFGRENLELLEKLATQGAILLDPDNPEGDKIATDIVRMVEQLERLATRKIEKTAGKGDVHKALEGVGYIAATVVGAESAVIDGVVITAKIVGKGTKLITGAGKTDDVARAAAAAEELSDAGKLAPDTTAAGRRPTTGAARTAPGESPKIEEIAIIIDPNAGKIDPATGDPSDLLVGGSVKLSNGQTAQLVPDAKLGEGSFSTAFTAKTADGRVITGADGKPLVIKVTNNKADGLDGVGYKGLEGIDANVIEVPRVHSSAGLGDGLGKDFSGGSIHVVDEGPADFKKVATDGSKTPEGYTKVKPMTGGQAIAFDKAMRALNEKGWVWLDNKYDNYSFRKVGEPDEWKLVIIDPGGIIPIKGLDPKKARELQQFIDNPTWGRAGSQMNRMSRQARIASKFDEDIDFDLIFKLTGKRYDTLMGGSDASIPYNVQNGTIFKKTSDLAAASTPEEVAAARKKLRTAQQAGEGADNVAGPATAAGDALPPPKVDGEGPQSNPSVAREGDAKPVKSETGDGAVTTDEDGYIWPQKRTPYRDFSNDEEGGGAGNGMAISMGGGSFTPVVPPIFFEFGPSGSIWDEDSWIQPPTETGSAWDGSSNSGDGILVELIRIIRIDGNNPYNQQDPLESGSNKGSSGSDSDSGSGSGLDIQVVQLGSEIIPISQLSIASPDACSSLHYHASSSVRACSGVFVSDPAPRTCGYGVVGSEFDFPLASCANP